MITMPLPPDVDADDHDDDEVDDDDFRDDQTRRREEQVVKWKFYSTLFASFQA